MPTDRPRPLPKAIHGISVAHFFETYGARLKLELITGSEGLHRLIREPAINRPALALTGFFKYFANKRIQVLGAAEMTFLRSLPENDQRGVIKGMADRHIPCLVLTRNFTFPRPMLDVARERRLPVFRTPMITMNFVNMATLYVDNEFAPATTEQGTTVDIKGVGVLIRGDSGVGKSECALALIERGHSLVSDDVTVIKLLDERELSASSRAITRGYIECRGIGIINVAEMFGIKCVRLEKRIDMVVSLREWTPDAVEERTGLEENFYEILGIKLPHFELFVRPGRDIARLVEVAAMVQALKRMGHDPARDFNDRLIAQMAEHPQPIKPSPLAATDPSFPGEERRRPPVF